MPEKQLEEITCTKLHETPNAILVTDDGGKKKVWLPKSLVEYSVDHSSGVCTVVAPIWLLKQKELI